MLCSQAHSNTVSHGLERSCIACLAYNSHYSTQAQHANWLPIGRLFCVVRPNWARFRRPEVRPKLNKAQVSRAWLSDIIESVRPDEAP